MKKRTIRTLLAVLLCLCLVVSISCIAFADFGNFGGDSDSGGSSSSDSDGGGGFIGAIVEILFEVLFEILIQTTVGRIIFIAAIIALIVFLIVRSVRNRHNPSTKDTMIRAERNAEFKAKLNNFEPSSRSQPSVEQSVPQFDNKALTDHIEMLYRKLQDCWTKKDLTPLRPYFSDTYFAQAEHMVDEFRRNNQTNYVENIEQVKASVLSAFKDADKSHCLVEVSAIITDYVLDDETGELISGDKHKRKLMTYEYDMILPTKDADGAETTEICCPNCGATVELNQSGVCPYCDSVLMQENTSYVLNGIRGVSQFTL